MNKFDPDAYLSGLNINVMHFGLESVTALLKRFGSPQNSCRTILVGGTNGKGSTAAMIASVLKRGGYKTGLYTSPHLADVRERIVIDGKKIPFNKFAAIVAQISEAAPLPVTYFEVLTAAAFIHFQREQVDIAVMEVGLGGRLDATNVCRPVVSVITNIGLEHTAVLGRTLSSIAAEKAGIVRPSGVCVTGAVQKKAVEVISWVCRQREAKLYRLGRDFRIIRRRGGAADYLGINRRIKGIRLSLPGAHQWSNAALTLAAVEVVEKNGYSLTDEAVCTGLENTRWEARMEVLCDRPLFLLDGAHNPSGIAALCRSLRHDFPRRRLMLIFAALADKDCKRMLQKIVPLADTTFLPALRSERAVAPGALARIVESLGGRAVVVRSPDEAADMALSQVGEDDMICAAGSLYLAGEIKQTFQQTHSCGKA